MKQYKVLLLSQITASVGWRSIHANNEQEAGEKAMQHYKGCEVIEVKKQSRGKKK